MTFFKFKPFGLAFLFATVLFTSSCVKEALDDFNQIKNINGVTMSPGFTLPLMDATVGLKELYNASNGNGFINRGTDGSYTFVYASHSTLQSPQFPPIPPIGIDYSLPLDAATALIFNNVGSFSNSISNYAVIPVSNGEKFKQIFIKKGSFTFNITCDLKHQTQIIFYYPSITNKQGKPLRDTLDLTYTGASPIVFNKTIVLDDYTIDLTDNGISYNVIPYLFQLNLMKITGNPIAKANDQITISQSFNIDECRGINGYVGKFLIQSINEESKIDMFSSASKDQFDFKVKLKDPRLRFTISSGFGIPITAKIGNISMVNSDGTEFPVKIDLFKDTFTLPAPAAIGGFASRDYVIDRNNSNLDDIINNALINAPQSVKYKVDIFANNNDVETDNFMFDTSSLTTDVAMEIPLDIQLSDFVMDFPFKQPLPQEVDMTKINIEALAQNTLPLDVKLQVLFARGLDSTNIDSFEVLDSLFQSGLILSKAIVDANGTVIESPSNYSSSFMSKERYLKLRDVDKADMIVLRAYLETSRDNTGKQQYVKIYNTQSISLKMGINAKGDVKYKFKQKEEKK